MNMLTPPKIPEFKTTKSGYEIRTDILKMAMDMSQFDYTQQFQQLQYKSSIDKETGQLVQTVELPPIPGIEAVLKSAQQLYDFVTATNKK